MRSRVRFRMAPTSSSVMPPRSATSSEQVSAISQTSRCGKLSLIAPVSRIDVQVQVVRAAHERARPRHALALLAARRALDVGRIDEQLGQPPLVARQTLGRDGLRSDAAIAAGRMHLAANPRHLGLWRVVVFESRVVGIIIHGHPPRSVARPRSIQVAPAAGRRSRRQPVRHVQKFVARGWRCAGPARRRRASPR